IDAGGHLASWTVAGGASLAGGVPGALGGAAGADAVNELVNSLKQDSSNIVTEETAELYADRGADAQRLLNQKLWEHRMWDEGQGPPIDWATDDGDQPRNVGGLNNEDDRYYRQWLDKEKPYSVDQHELESVYNNGKITYDEATGKTKIDYSDTNNQ